MTDVLDISQLRTFVTIADCGGFVRAASALHLSQPTVSQHVRSLERKLDQTLVERAGRATRFTAAGERLLVQARRILSVHDEALTELEATEVLPLVIGSTETAVEPVLPELIATLRGAFPERHMRFVVDRSTGLADAVARGLVDVAVLLGFDPDRLPGRAIGSLDLAWFAAPGWSVPAAGDIPLVAYADPCGMRRRAIAELGVFGRSVDVVAESSTLEGVIAAARAGLGVAVLPTRGALTHAGLDRVDTLPDLGPIGVHLAARRGADDGIVATAAAALAPLFAPRAFAAPISV